jgi:hypothetical protein
MDRCVETAFGHLAEGSRRSHGKAPCRALRGAPATGLRVGVERSTIERDARARLAVAEQKLQDAPILALAPPRVTEEDPNRGDRTVPSRKSEARAAGVWYLLLAITAPIGLVYVPAKLFVPGDASATAENLRTSESLLRVGVASELVHQVICVFLVLALYRLFKSVSERLAVQVVILGALVSVPIVFVNVLNELAALAFAQGSGPLASFDDGQRTALASLFLQLHGDGIQVASIFWGLWLFPFGALVVRCGFVPRALGFLLWAAGASYLATSSTALVQPSLASSVARWALPLQMGELPMVVWLLVWGAKERAVPPP